jgi:hypothetical protein
MSNESLIENLIQKAIKRGEFDNLEGAGKPLNLEDYFAAPQDERMGFAMLRSNNFVPPEVELMQEVDDLKRQLSTAPDESTVQKLGRKLNERSLALSIMLENRNRRRRTAKD